MMSRDYSLYYNILRQGFCFSRDERVWSTLNSKIDNGTCKLKIHDTGND